MKKKISFDKYRLLAPGPVPLSSEVRKELSEEMIHHRTPKFDKTLQEVLKGLKWVFQTQQPVFIHSATGSGAMESALINCLSPGDEVLAIVSGKFGERWRKMAQSFGYKVHSLEVPWGQNLPLEKVEESLRTLPQLKAVLCQACETSTATLHPIQELAQLTSDHSQALLMVDAITALGATKLPMDEWQLDVVVAGSQKAFQIPTGLSFVALSERAWQRALKATTPRFYFDLRLEHAANQKGETFFSSSVALIRALRPVLESLSGDGLNRSIARSQELMKKTHQILETLNLSLFSQAPSPSVTALMVPEGIDGGRWRQHLEEKYQITLMGGQDQLKGKILRVGHLGAISDEDMQALGWALALSLNDLKPQSLSSSQLAELETQLGSAMPSLSPQ